MRFALSDKERIEATPGASGSCPGCNAELLAKCGTKRVWHWSHRGTRHCDPWWENETEWHRNWKDRFPKEWQEVAARDGSGELHIADIKTPGGLVVEFQHSSIKPEEIRKRTGFYGNIIWVVDGTRRTTDKAQYERMLLEHIPDRFDGVDIFTVFSGETRLLKEWDSLGRIIGFDFGGDTLCLLTAVQGKKRYLFDFSKTEFTRTITEGKALPTALFEEPRNKTGRMWRRR